MLSDITVYSSRSTRTANLIAILSIIALPVGLFLYGWFFQDAAATLLFVIFGVFVSGGTLIFIHKNKILRFDSAPILVIRREGLEIPGDEILSWQVIKNAIVFTYEGDKIIGLRLREDIPPAKRFELEAHFRSRLHWQLFGMPLALSFSSASVPGEDLLAQLQARGVKISFAEKPIALGHEFELT